MRLLVVALCLLSVATAAAAEVARVVGGEHADFTRLVVEARQAGDWRLGRAVDGYELQMAAAVTAYDVTRAFEKIPKDRITAVWRDPDSGRLRFSLACACHAIAFEFRPGIVVIDIRSGPPPESSFEQPLDPETSLPPEDPAQPPPAESAAAFDWVAMQREREKAPTGNDLPMPLPAPERCRWIHCAMRFWRRSARGRPKAWSRSPKARCRGPKAAAIRMRAPGRASALVRCRASGSGRTETLAAR